MYLAKKNFFYIYQLCLMFKLKQILSVWLMKTIWSTQATWTKIYHFFPANIWTKTMKKGQHSPFLNFQVLSTPFKGTFHKRSDKFSHFTPKPWEQLQNPGSTPKLWVQFQNPESSHPSLVELQYLYKICGRWNTVCIKSQYYGE